MIKRMLFLSLPLLIVSGCGNNDTSQNGPQAVSLGPITGGPATGALDEASGYAILAKTGITNVTPSLITGNIGVYPEVEAAMTAFAFTRDPEGSNTFSIETSTPSQLVGRAYASDLSAPTPANTRDAVLSMEAAYTDAAGRTNPTATELYAGDLSGQTLSPGLYKWGTGVVINGGPGGGLTLSGGPNDTWIFQIAQDLVVAADTDIHLVGGARAKNIFWQVAGGAGATIGAGSIFNGIILAQTAINFQAGAVLNGRAYAQSAVNLIANTVTAH